MKASLMSVAVLTLLASANIAVAEDRACTIEGTLTFMGESIYSKDCIELHADGKVEDLKRACDGLAQMSEKMGGKAGNVTYSATCPLPAQGACVGMGGTNSTAYYYARTDDNLAGLPQSCEMMGGKWKAAN